MMCMWSETFPVSVIAPNANMVIYGFYLVVYTLYTFPNILELLIKYNIHNVIWIIYFLFKLTSNESLAWCPILAVKD